MCYTQHSKINLHFRNETYAFLVRGDFPPDISSDDIVSIVNKKFKTTVGPSEISYHKAIVSPEEYNKSTLDHYRANN